MKKQLLTLFAFLTLMGFISTHEITKISNVICDPLGKETFNLEVVPEGDIIGLSEFKVTLKNYFKEEITATCTLKDSSSDIPKDISDSVENHFSTEETKSDEVNLSTEKFETSSDSSTIMIESDKEFSSDSTEGIVKDYSTDTITDTKDTTDKVIIDTTDTDKVIDTDMLTQTDTTILSDGKGRRLEGNEPTMPVTYVCTLDNKIKSAQYDFEKADNPELKVTKNITSNLFYCQSEEEMKKRADILLSFRQVSGFNKEKLSFNFYGLTTQDIKKEISISFFIYLVLGLGPILTLDQSICTTS